MIRALWTGATGMSAQQINLDIIANNLANVSTTGYKKSRAEFQDLIYETIRPPGVPVATGSMYPVGLQVGLGTMLASTQKMHTPGPRQETRNKLDLAIDGEGFFEVLLPDGTSAYTRDGAFKKDSENRIVTGDGYVLFPELTIPEEATDISITEDGTVFVVLEGDPKNIEEIGRIEIVRFINPAGLASIGRNLYKETPASGAPIPGFPGELGLGRISQGFLEMSNVDVVEEMVKMIIVQRAYELNSRSILTADSLLSSAVTLKR